jgi:rhamnogalacturonan endolyase
MRTLIESLESRRLLSVVTIGGRQMEGLDRGVVALSQGGGQVYVGWRLLATDPDDVTFNLYRSTGGGAAVKLNGSPIAQTTDFVVTGGDLTQSNAFFVRTVIDGVEQAGSRSFTLPANAPAQQFLRVPLQIPAGGTTPDNVAYTYNANDTSIADLDGDGQYELIVKWDPTNSKDNAQDGYTGNVYLDAYKLDGTRLWRIDLGRNIRAGAHYTQFIAYDLDSDGKAEVAMKTADGTIDGVGTVIGNGAADWRNTSGRILTGPEFLTIFNGQTGAAMATTNYLPARGTVSSWGDSYGNRVDRFLATVAYLDGQRPSLVMTRGYYAKSVLAAWDWRGGQLTSRWVFDSSAAGNGAYAGQGNHNITAADVDGDGKDEIVFGAATIDDNGTGLYSSGYGHGDALHVSDMDPSRPGLEVFQVHETQSLHMGNGGTLRSAATGALLAAAPGGTDVGRGVAFDIDPRPGYEYWTSANGNIFNVDGTIVAAKPSNMHVNFGVWWDADPFRETLDGTTISNWTAATGRVNFDLDPNSSNTFPPNVSSNNGTKATPALSADLFGDWREEVIWRRSDNTALHIYTTTIPATMRLFTLMHDVQYREAIAWQNVAYNQPPHPSFFLGDGMTLPPQPSIYTVAATPAIPGDFNGDNAVDRHDLPVWRQTFGDQGVTTFLPGDANADGDVDGDDFLTWQRNVSAPATGNALAAQAALAERDAAYASMAGFEAQGISDSEANHAAFYAVISAEWYWLRPISESLSLFGDRSNAKVRPHTRSLDVGVGPTALVAGRAADSPALSRDHDVSAKMPQPCLVGASQPERSAISAVCESSLAKELDSFRSTGLATR